jgi:uncharacterized protein YjbI with pentapeptide repeats
MANQEHLDILRQGVEIWNQWRKENPSIGVDLREANLTGVNLTEADLKWINFQGADLSKANLRDANLTLGRLTSANLEGASLTGAILHMAILSKANLQSASLFRASLNGANLLEANLSGADLMNASLVNTNLQKANVSDCRVYGISVWEVQLQGAIQHNLVITNYNDPTITVDNLKIAQFIYLLLNNEEIRDVIDTITSKVVLILGRFTAERKAVLDALRDELRKRNYSPVLFDFENPASRDFTETVRTLAHLSRFIIADLTEPSSIPQELQAIVPDLEVPIQPLLLEAKREYSMFVDFRKYHWVLPIYLYKDQASLIASLKNDIIEPADKKARELVIEKAKRLERP